MSTNKTVCEHALSRVLAYLAALGMPLTRELSIVALKLVEEALSSEDEDVFVYVMTQLPQRFHLPPLSLPKTAPPIHRGSIGYGEHA